MATVERKPYPPSLISWLAAAPAKAPPPAPAAASVDNYGRSPSQRAKQEKRALVAFVKETTKAAAVKAAPAKKAAKKAGRGKK